MDSRQRVVSIHAPRAGGDVDKAASGFQNTPFQSTPPARGATRPGCLMDGDVRSFNPRPPRGGRPALLVADEALARVSIHAPRAGGDPSRR